MFVRLTKSLLRGAIYSSRFSTTARISSFNQVKSGHFTSAGLLAGSASLAALSLFSWSQISNDAQNRIENSVTLDSSIDPFPISLKKDTGSLSSEDFHLLGHGMRSVTFLSFKVYGIGIYVSERDIPLLKKIIHRVRNVSGRPLNASLMDPNESVLIIEQLIDEGVHFAARISPVRNTDFNHLRDGLVKSILAHPRSKESRETVGAGIEELRNVFKGHRGSVPKNHVLYLETLRDGKLNVAYYNAAKFKVTNLGTVSNSDISKLLFLQYLSGKKPLSEQLRKSCVDGLEGL